MTSLTDLPQQPNPIQPQPAETPKTITFPAVLRKYIFLLGIYLLLVAPTFYALLDAQKVFGIDVDSWYIGWKLFSVTLSAILFWIALSQKKMLWFCILLIPFSLLLAWAVFIDFMTLRPIRLEVYFGIILVTTALLLSSRKYYPHFMQADNAPSKSPRWRRLATTILAFIGITALTTGAVGYLLEEKKWPVTPQSTQSNPFKSKKFPVNAFLTTTVRPTLSAPSPSGDLPQGEACRPGHWCDPSNRLPTATPTLKIYRNEKLGFELTYQEGFEVVEETADKVSFGYLYPFLTISTNQITDYKFYKHCNETDGKTYPCLESGERWGQDGDIAETKLGQVGAKSFYIDVEYPQKDYPHGVYHIVQTNSSPKIEAKMYISGEGLDGYFKQILSTFKILNTM